MDLLEEYAKSDRLTIDNVLALVDEYTLYAYYLGYEPELSMRYRSPIRHDDENPSFSIYSSNGKYYEYMWKDHARDESGSIFKLIRILCGLRNLDETLRLIDKDFELGFDKGDVIVNKIQRYDKPKPRDETAIRIKIRSWKVKDWTYWESQGITVPYLQSLGNVYPVECFWTRVNQLTPISPRGLCYAYRSADYYLIYQPNDKEFKFINGLPEKFIQGFDNLNYSNNELLVLTKSWKETIWFRENMNIESVAGRSETIMIPEPYIRHFKAKFKRIIVMLDPDSAGYKQAYKYKEMYDLDWCTLLPCMMLGAKDPTDCTKKHGLEKTVSVIRDILYGH